MTTDYKAAMDDGIALEQARNATGGSIDRFVERMAERVGAKASVHAVFGEPIERDGITIVPVARVRWGSAGARGGARSPSDPGAKRVARPPRPQ